MVDIVTRLGKGSPLTNAEVDANFTNLAEVSGVTGEPMGHEDRTTSTISFNASTRTFTIAPTGSSFTVWCKGKKVVVSSARTVTIPNTTGMYSIYFDSTGTLAAKSGYFTFSDEAPTAYIYWNATTGTAPYFGDERHGVVLDWQTHEYLHRTRGAALASGFSASGYVLGGNGSSNSHAQLTLEGGTFFDEDMKIIVTATNTPTAGTWEQDLVSPARIPVLYLSGTAWVIDAPTDYPLKQGTARPQYNAFSGGVWSTADVANNKYATSWILATNNLTYPVIAIIGQAESDLQSAAEAVDFTALQLPGFPSVEFRPLYKLIFQCADSCTNAVHASLVSITDIRSIAAAGTAASIVTDHGNLSGLSDDDHPQYLSVDTVRGSLTAAVKASFLPSQTSNAGKFLQTDGTVTSWQALTSGNVTTALGFTPYNATNPSGFITGITSGNVTTALGFTPYNATNPSGYVTAAGARGSISVTGAGSYDSATGVINIVGGVTSFNTRTGAITLSSSDVTTALGFTPYNSTNPNGYLTGITSTQVTTALGYTPYNSSNPSGYITGITSGMVTTALGFTPYNNSNPSGYITSAALSSYLTTASAASTYLPLTGGSLTGNLGVGVSSPLTRLDTRIADAFSTVVSDTSLNNNTSTVARFSYTTDPGAGITAGTGVGIGLSAVPNRGEVFLVSTNPGTSKDESDFAVWTTTGGVSSENFRVRGNGNVGVGTTSPSQKLEVYQSNSSLNVAKLWHVSGNAIIINASYNYYDAYNHIFRSLSGTTTYATFDNAGNFGLGTTTPSGAAGLAFAINGGAAQTRIALKNSTTGDAAGDGFQILLDSGSSEVAFEQRENAGIRFITNNVEAFRILNNQNVGIGTSSPSTALYVKRTSGNSGIYTDYNGTNIGRIEAASNGNLYIGLTTGSGDIAIGNTANATAVNLTSAGSFGIGTSSPASKFVVNGGTVNTTTYTSSEARIADGSIHAMKTVAGGVFEAFRAINADTTAGTTVRVLGAATSDPFNNGNGGKVFIDAVRTATNMDLVFSLNNASGAAPVERFRFYGSGAFNSVGAITQNGSQVLTAGNYNSYSPTLTGTGASGTWGISITGNAAGLTDNSGWMLYRGTVAEASIDTATANGFYQRQNTGEQQGLLVMNPGGSLGIFQMYMLWQGGLQFRNKTDSATWNAWKTVLTSLNYNSYSPTLTGTGASGTWGISITGNAATATVSNTTKGVGLTDPSIGAGGLWVTSASGLNIARNGTSYIGLDAGNVSTYALPIGGGTVSGTVTANYFQGGGWGTYLNPSTAAIRGNGGYGGALALVDGAYGIALYSVTGTLHFGFGSNTAVTAKATMDTNGNFNVAGALTQASNQVLHAGNYNSYAPTRTGTGASGTWGISITGTASGETLQTVAVRGGVSAGQKLTLSDANHYLRYQSTGFSGVTIDGPQLAGHQGGELASNYGGDNWSLRWNNSGDTFSRTSSRAPVFYDSNNTAYFVDPASTSYMNSVRYVRGAHAYFERSVGTDVGAIGWHTNDSFYVAGHPGYGPGAGNDVRVYGFGNSLHLGNATYGDVLTVANGYTQGTGSIRAPIFYDSNDTGRYLDPNGTSILGGLFVAATASTGRSAYGSGTANLVLYAESTYGRATIDFRSGVNYPSDGAQIYYETATDLASGETSRLVIRCENDAADSILIRAGQIVYNSTTVDGGSQATGHIFQYGNADRMYVYSDNVTAVGSFRAPIFYDSENTANYVDPTGTSVFVGLSVGSSALTVTGGSNSIIAQDNGGAGDWRGRIISRNATYDKAAFLGVYGGLTGVFAHNHALNGWTDLYVNTTDGSGGGAVRMPASVLINGSQALHAGNFSSYALPTGGGTLSGTLSFQQPVGLGFANGQYIKDNGSGGLIINSGAAVNINGTSVTVNGQTAIHAGNYSSYALPIGGGTVTGNVLFSNSGTTKRGIQGTCGDNDMWFVGGGATSSNSGFMEIATGDDGQTSGTYEPIYVSQYGPGDPLTGTLVRRGSLLDNNGNTTFPLNITAYSDERLKTNWRSMPDDYVTRLAQVKVGIYDRTDENNTTQVGVGAQSFQTLLPEAIVTAADDFGTLSVNYGGAALASAVELAKDNVELRARIERLESLINKLIGD